MTPSLENVPLSILIQQCPVRFLQCCVPPSSRGRLGGGWGVFVTKSVENPIPSPTLPLKGREHALQEPPLYHKITGWTQKQFSNQTSPILIHGDMNN
jgi:hypothetical protein